MKREHINRDFEYGPPCAAPAYFPYAHPTIGELDAWEEFKRARSAKANAAKRQKIMKDKIISDYLSGMTASEVAEKYGRSTNGLRVCLSRWGIKLPTEEKGKRIWEGRNRASCVNEYI